MQITGIDHIVLTVRSIDTTVRFYESVLGMRQEIFGEDRVALNFGQQKINLHQQGKEFEPKAEVPKPGSGDLCFVAAVPLLDAMDHVRKAGVTIIEGPVNRTGAHGPILSFYFRDPDGNLIEIASYDEDPCQ